MRIIYQAGRIQLAEVKEDIISAFLFTKVCSLYVLSKQIKAKTHYSTICNEKKGSLPTDNFPK